MTEALLELEDITVRFGGITAVSDVTLRIAKGEIMGLIGPNGAGKTTLANVIAGATKPTAGKMAFNGHTDGPWPNSTAVRRGIVRTFQTPRAFKGLTVAENLALAAVHADQMTETFQLSPWLDHAVTELPFGVLRRLGLVLALSRDPKLLVLDEPAVGLTPPEIDDLAGVVRAIRDSGVTILLIDHNIPFLMGLVDSVSVLSRGALIFEGDPAAAQSDPGVVTAYFGDLDA